MMLDGMETNIVSSNPSPWLRILLGDNVLSVTDALSGDCHF